MATTSCQGRCYYHPLQTIQPAPAAAAEDMETRAKERTAELTATLEESKGLEAELQAMLKGAGATAAPQVLEASAQASRYCVEYYLYRVTVGKAPR